MLAMVIDPSLAIGTTYLCGLACTATIDTMFSRSKSSTSGHVTQDLDGVERPSVRHLVENLFFVQSQKISRRNLERFRIGARLTALGVKFTPLPIYKTSVKRHHVNISLMQVSKTWHSLKQRKN